MVLTHFFGIVFVYVGMFFLMTASVGILRFPDFYTRLHPSGVGDSLGAPLVIIGAALYQYSFFVLAKSLLIIFIMWVTNTTSCHALSRAAYKSGLRPLIDNS